MAESAKIKKRLVMCSFNIIEANAIAKINDRGRDQSYSGI